MNNCRIGVWGLAVPLLLILVPLASTMSVDEAILSDIMTSFVGHEASTCITADTASSTSFTFDWPGSSDPTSEWYPPHVGFEEDLFQAAMSHDDGSGRRSWTIRIGTGGNMYSHYAPDLHGESMAPQAHGDAPWIDEVQQQVAVNNNLNRKAPWNRPYFQHQAGAYQRDGSYTTVPFYSPSFARHCAGNTCTFASWGTQAHVPTPFTAPVMFITRYTNCGSGVIELTQAMHNFADVASDTTVDQTYFNTGWGGVRSSRLPFALEANSSEGSSTDSFDFANPDNVDAMGQCAWSVSSKSPGQMTNLNLTPGYTAFATSGLVSNGGTVPELPCRDNSISCSTNVGGCMVASCTDSQVSSGSHTRVTLRVSPGSTPGCASHGFTYTVGGVDYPGMKCNLRDTGFGRDFANLCQPWARVGFKRLDTGAVLEVAFVKHWTWNSGDEDTFLAIYEEDLATAISTFNSFFDNTADTVNQLDIEVVLLPTTSPPADYNPGVAESAFTYVYGRGEDYSQLPSPNVGDGSVTGVARRRFGMSDRDYTVFTVNWLGQSRLKPGQTYINRSFQFASELGAVEALGEDLREKVYIDQIDEVDYNARRVDLYKDGDRFEAVAAADLGGTSSCWSETATVSCSGWSTPQTGKSPFFYITCGTNTHVGQDPYHFSPSFGGTFPGHAPAGGTVRSYVCDGQSDTVRPTWKLLGFFSPGDCAGIESATLDDSVCPDKAPTQSPTTKPTQSPTTKPTQSPTTQAPTTLSPTTQSPTTQAPTTLSPTTQSPTESPTTQAPTTSSPTTQAPTQSPTTQAPTTSSPTTQSPTQSPTTQSPTTSSPTTQSPTTQSPTTQSPTTQSPTTNPTQSPTTQSPTTLSPTTQLPTQSPTTQAPTTSSPTTQSPTQAPSTQSPTTSAPTVHPFAGYEQVGGTDAGECADKDDGLFSYAQYSQTASPEACAFKCSGLATTAQVGLGFKPSACRCYFDGSAPNDEGQTFTSFDDSGTGPVAGVSNASGENWQCYRRIAAGTVEPTTKPTEVPTASPTTLSPTTQSPTLSPTTQAPTTQSPTTQSPTTQSPTTLSPTTQSPTTQAPTTQAPTTLSPTTQAPTTQSPTTSSPTTQSPTGSPSASPSAEPTTGSPSISPSRNPTSNPSPFPSSPPTVHPFTGYEGVGSGNGECTDANGSLYSYVQYTSVATPGNCATKCSDLGLSNQVGLGSSTADICHCYFDGTAPTVGVADQTSQNNGSGPIAGVNNSTGWQCYRLVIAGTVSPTPNPSSSPSAQPTTDYPSASPSARPTSSPSTGPSAKPTTSQPTTSQPTTSKPTTNQPTTSQPTTNQPTTSKPTTSSPSFSPVTSSPSSLPSAKPTTFNPTSQPSRNPTTFPTSRSPTSPPSAKPTTSKPSRNPTAFPTSRLPTSQPTTSSAQPTTSSAPALDATFDAQMTAPKCSGLTSACTAPASLLQGTAANNEPNQLGVRASNTIDNCRDGTSGTYNTDESIEWLSIVSVDPKTDQPWELPLRVGGRAKIITGLHAYLVGNSDPSNDYADFYYSTDVDPPIWTSLGTKRLARGEVDSNGFGTFESEPFTIPNSSQSIHAIRVDFRYNGNPSANACTGGSWADTDDLAFYVAPNVPSTAPPALEATFDSQITAPKCSELSRSCTAPTSLLQGTAANNEPNQLGVRASNTIDNCRDGTSGTYNTDESIEWLSIVSVDPDLPLRVGGRAKIITGLHAYLVGNSDPSNDYADFYYSTDVDPPNWSLLGTKRLARGEVDFYGFGTFESEPFTILDSSQSIHAIRVDFRYNGNPSANACTGGSWADTDDLAFYVAPNAPATTPL